MIELEIQLRAIYGICPGAVSRLCPEQSRETARFAFLKDRPRASETQGIMILRFQRPANERRCRSLIREEPRNAVRVRPREPRRHRYLHKHDTHTPVNNFFSTWRTYTRAQIILDTLWIRTDAALARFTQGGPIPTGTARIFSQINETAQEAVNGLSNFSGDNGTPLWNERTNERTRDQHIEWIINCQKHKGPFYFIYLSLFIISSRIFGRFYSRRPRFP